MVYAIASYTEGGSAKCHPKADVTQAKSLLVLVYPATQSGPGSEGEHKEKPMAIRLRPSN